MSLKLRVTNTGEVDIFRLEHMFPAGETVPAEISEHYYDLIDSHPDLDAEIVGLDANAVGSTDPAVLRGLNATQAAGEKARLLGVDLTQVIGTGQDGRITAGDVDGHASENDLGESAPRGDAGPEVPNTDPMTGAGGAADPAGPGGDAKVERGYDDTGGSMQGKDLPPDRAPDRPPDPVRDEPKQKDQKS